MYNEFESAYCSLDNAVMNTMALLSETESIPQTLRQAPTELELSRLRAAEAYLSRHFNSQ